MENDKVDILMAVKKVCKSGNISSDHFNCLEEIFDHVSKHENEAVNQRAESIKRIIDKKKKKSEA